MGREHNRGLCTGQYRTTERSTRRGTVLGPCAHASGRHRAPEGVAGTPQTLDELFSLLWAGTCCLLC